MSLTHNGWQKLPSGLIVQWVSSTAVNGQGETVTLFPISFPNNTLKVLVSTRIAEKGDDDKMVQLRFFDNQRVKCWHNNISAGGIYTTTTADILAIGY